MPVDLALDTDIVNINDDDKDSLLGHGKDIEKELFTGNEGAKKTTIYKRCCVVAWPKRWSFLLQLYKVRVVDCIACHTIPARACVSLQRRVRRCRYTAWQARSRGHAGQLGQQRPRARGQWPCRCHGRAAAT